MQGVEGWLLNCDTFWMLFKGQKGMTLGKMLGTC